jgi:hypothetical protein
MVQTRKCLERVVYWPPKEKPPEGAVTERCCIGGESLPPRNDMLPHSLSAWKAYWPEASTAGALSTAASSSSSE